MAGFLATMTQGQRAAAKAYQGHDTHGIRWIAWDYTQGNDCPIPHAKAGQYAIKNEDGRIEYPKCEAARAGWHKHPVLCIKSTKPSDRSFSKDMDK